MASSPPLDPRLLKRARAARGYVILTAVFGLVTALLVVAQALLLAHVLAPLITGEAALADLGTKMIALVIVFFARAGVVGLQERFAYRAATRTITQLRAALIEHATALGPRWLSGGRDSQVATLATRGLEALEPYFVRYLPQLLLAATVTPITLVIVWWQDWTSGLTILVTLPLVPIFMILVGKLTESASRRKIKTMTRLGSQVLDLISGLPTLKALGRERGPGARVRQLGESHRRATMGTLRIAFLSGMVLELLTTLSVALVAVGIGMRLVYGWMDLVVGLAVLILAPEVFLPIRQVGTHFHASSDGIAAAEEVFAVLETPLPAVKEQAQELIPAPDLTQATLTVDALSVAAGDRGHLAPSNLSFTLHPGEVLALRGANGTGKTTASLVALNLLRPHLGEVRVNGTPLREIDPASWWAQIAWVPQRAMLLPGTVLENVTLGLSEGAVSDAALAEAAQITGFDEVLNDLPRGWETKIGHGGVGLSLGQRQRLALTRALVRPAPLVILDEPTAHLDAENEAVVLRAVSELRARGRSVLLIAHRQELLELANEVVTVRAGVGDNVLA